MAAVENQKSRPPIRGHRDVTGRGVTGHVPWKGPFDNKESWELGGGFSKGSQLFRSCFSLGLSQGKTTIRLKVNSKHPTKTRLVKTQTLICSQKTRPAIASHPKKFYRPLSFVVG